MNHICSTQRMLFGDAFNEDQHTYRDRDGAYLERPILIKAGMETFRFSC